MTANAMAGDRQKCLDAGMDDYLPKPVTRSELERCLHHWWNPQVAALEALESGADTGDADAVAPTHGAAGAVVEDVVAATAEALPPAASPAWAPAPARGPTAAAAAPAIPAIDGPATPPATMPAAASPSASPAMSAIDPSIAAAGQAPSRVPPPLIDQEVLDELRAMLGGEVDRLIDVFLEDTPRLVSALEAAASSGPDYAALRDAAHSLKSSSANLGAMSLSAAAKRIEMGARQQSLDRPAVAVALVANEFQRARQQLRASQRSEADSM
jgi:HPt (histidine-containing phosphotransfer) domain-containing protein